MKVEKVKVGDTLTIKVRVTRVAETVLGETLVTILVGGQPNTVGLSDLEVVGKG